MKAGAWWRADWFAGFALLAAAVALQLGADFTGALERRFYDLATTATSPRASDRIAIIAIDAQSMASLGPWPWPRDVHARLLDLLTAAKARTVVHTAFFFEPQRDPGLAFIRKIKDVLDSVAEPTGEVASANTQISALVAQAQSALDTDALLATSLQKAGNVLLPSVFTLGAPQGQPEKRLPDFARKSALDGRNGYSVMARRTLQPTDLIGNAAAGVGHLDPIRDADGVVRVEPLLVDYFGKAVPSMALLAVLNSQNLQPSDIRLLPGNVMQVGKLRITTDDAARLRPQLYRGRAGKPAFAMDSFDDVLSGKIAAEKYADKIVIIGATVAGATELFAVPGDSALSATEWLAHVTSSLLQADYFVQPAWSLWAIAGAFLLVAAYTMAVLPRLSLGVAAGITLMLFVTLLSIEWGLLAAAAMWIKLMFPATAVLLGHLAVIAKRHLLTETLPHNADTESDETNRLMGQALQGQGQLDLAFERFRRASMGEVLMGHLYRLALDFEHQRQFKKAGEVYQHMAEFAPGFKDILSRLARARALSDAASPSTVVNRPVELLPRETVVQEMPMLGRYRVEKELGKGAMGVVYLGRDPTIGRVVAIKTLALSQAFAGEDLAHARGCFFREAETAGRLQHQDIVTIFDAAEEHGLAFIAMEFLKGHDLTAHCKREHLLPIVAVVAIVTRVALALDYAHAQNVVHRDIKPANIMYDPTTDSVKVTDFGIARITDSSKTQTGLVMGTPSFMSPEQLAGKKVDGRSDLYSLGVMLYQLLGGVLPFRGDSMSELMFKIANEEAQDIRSVRPEIPEELAQVVAQALSKRPQARYQSGAQFAAALQSVPHLPMDGRNTASVVDGMDIEI